MGDQKLLVHLGLDTPFQDDFSESGIECRELVKSIRGRRDVVVRDVYDCLMNPSADELNPKEYTPAQRALVAYVRERYDAVSHIPGYTPNFMYQIRPDITGFLQFDEKLSQHEDAFHEKESTRKVGNLEERTVENHVYLMATPQDYGGRY